MEPSIRTIEFVHWQSHLQDQNLPLWRRWRRRGYYLLTLVTLRGLSCLPVRWGQGLCLGLVRLAMRVRPRERRQAWHNLGLAFPELPAKERKSRFEAAVAALGRNLYDTLVLEKQARRDFPAVTDEGVIATVEDLRQRGRGVLILTGHLGCWELLGAFLAARLQGMAVITGTVHNEPVDSLLQARRVRLGLTPLPRDRDLRPVVRALRAGEVVAVLLDQNTQVHNMPVSFFGHVAPTPVGFARLALRYRIPVLPVAIIREGDGHRVMHLPPLTLTGGESQEEVGNFLAQCNNALETFIRRNPAEWVWFHDRWGSAPGSECSASANFQQEMGP
jgi:KDO2-lipid IV(A) lauroyltransferase